MHGQQQFVAQQAEAVTVEYHAEQAAPQTEADEYRAWLLQLRNDVATQTQFFNTQWQQLEQQEDAAAKALPIHVEEMHQLRQHLARYEVLAKFDENHQREQLAMLQLQISQFQGNEQVAAETAKTKVKDTAKVALALKMQADKQLAQARQYVEQVTTRGHATCLTAV